MIIDYNRIFYSENILVSRGSKAFGLIIEKCNGVLKIKSRQMLRPFYERESEVMGAMLKLRSGRIKNKYKNF